MLSGREPQRVERLLHELGAQRVSLVSNCLLDEV